MQWFDPIVLPTAYVEDLRKDNYGSHLTFNFRDTQDLTDRTVLKFEVPSAHMRKRGNYSSLCVCVCLCICYHERLCLVRLHVESKVPSDSA